MKLHSLHHLHRNSATDRTHTAYQSRRQGTRHDDGQRLPTCITRAAALCLSLLISLPAILPAAAAIREGAQISYSIPDGIGDTTQSVTVDPEPVESTDTIIHTEKTYSRATLIGARTILSPAEPEMMAEELLIPPNGEDPGQAEITDSDRTPADSLDGAADQTDIPDTNDKPSAPATPEDTYEDIFDPDLPLTQELIARRIETRMNMQVRGGSKIYYPYPAGAMAVDLYKDGRRILAGQVADIGGTVYVPVQRFADLFGSFKTTYTAATEQVVITGKNLSVTVKVGDPYITVNERIFYTGKKVISLGGWIFVPLTSMCKALDADVNIRRGYYDAYITSGNPATVAWADDYYNATDLYWLSRIISAEAKGEPFAGQIAVGNVVLNRVRSSQFPNTVKGVIFDKKYGVQFSPVASGTIYQTPTASAVRAAKICLEGYSLSATMLYFYNPAIATSSWIGRTRPYVMTIGNHKFYA